MKVPLIVTTYTFWDLFSYDKDMNSICIDQPVSDMDGERLWAIELTDHFKINVDRNVNDEKHNM